MMQNDRYHKIYYTVNDSEFDDYLWIEDDISWGLDLSAEGCARSYFDNHDGWEIPTHQWSNGLEFRLWDEDRNFLGKFIVSMELEPAFRAWET